MVTVIHHPWVSGLEVADCSEAGAAWIGIEHLQAPITVHHDPDMQAKQATKHRGYCPRLWPAFIHPLLQVVIGARILTQPVLADRAKAGQQRQAKHLMPNRNAQSPAIEGNRPPSAILVRGGQIFFDHG